MQKRREWRKLHLGIDEKNSQIMAVELSDNKTGDAELFPDLLDAIEGEIEQITGDGAYDSLKCESSFD